MQIIDSQVHCFERNHPGRPWVKTFTGPKEVLGDDMVAEMDALGIAGAIMVSVFATYRFDSSYALTARNKHPTRFGLVVPVDSSNPAIADIIKEWATVHRVVGIRLLLNDEVSRDPANPGLNLALAEAARCQLPVNIAAWGRLDQVKELAKRNPNTRMVIDHLGIHPPMTVAAASTEPFKELPSLLALAECDNVAVKVSGTGVLSLQSYPYPDIWGPLRRVFDAFGFDRCMWGTDWTRAINFLTYRQGVDAFRFTDQLSNDERTKLMGETLTKIYNWRPAELAARR